MTITLTLLAVTIALFLWDRFPMEVVALGALVALVATGVLTTEEALRGFSNGLLIVLAGLFVVGGALVKSGVAEVVAGQLERLSQGRPERLLPAVMLSAAGLSAVTSSTATVAILMPAVVRAAAALGQSPSRFLIPLAYSCLIGGLLTLVATPPNLVVDEALRSVPGPGLGFFSLTPLGLLLVVIAVLYMARWGQGLLDLGERAGRPEKPPDLGQLLESYGALESLSQMKLPSSSTRWTSATLAQLELRSRHGLDVLGVSQPGDGRIVPAGPEVLVVPGATLYLRATPEALERYRQQYPVKVSPVPNQPQALAEGRLVAEVLLTPRSRLLGRTLSELGFSRRYGVRVLTIQRGGRNLTEGLAETTLRFGDALLVEGPVERLSHLESERSDFVVIGIPQEQRTQTGLTWEGKRALILFALMLVAITAGLPMEMVILGTALLFLAAGWISIEEAYRSIHWSSLLLIAGMMALSEALAKTGTLSAMADLLSRWGQGSSPALLLGMLYLVTAGLSQLISNTATAILLAPVALQTAAALHLSPHPLLVTVAVAASAAFSTPIASPVNTLVLGPGGYRFSDFVKVGLPLQVLTLGVVLVVVPLLFPF